MIKVGVTIAPLLLHGIATTDFTRHGINSIDLNGIEVELGPGDGVAIPRGVPHRARNIGGTVAELYISFDSAERQVEGE